MTNETLNDYIAEADCDETYDEEACPGCGCRPGEGYTDDCFDDIGCGYFKAFESNAKKSALDTLKSAVRVAVDEYDRSGDHKHDGGPFPGDCIRCNLLRIVDGRPVHHDTRKF